MIDRFSNKRFGKDRLVSLSGAAVAAVFLASLPGCMSGGLSAESVNSTLVDGYRVGAGDRLRVTVFDEDSLTGEYEIGEGGGLSIPLIDPIDASGKTPGQLSGMIANELKQGGYVIAPRVSVEIIQYRPFYILGEVVNPGEYPYSGELTLEQAVAKAGGYTPRAEKSVVELKRKDWESARRVQLDGPSLRIAPGDTITIGEAFF